MKISIIIPTHNRADLLKRAMESIIALRDEADFEVVIVDNNSTDQTREIAGSFLEYARYVFESNTSFTKARATGADNSRGDILLYLDDDVLVCAGSLKEIVSVFKECPECGVLAGKILPKYEEDPPDWAVACQKSFNGWSLYNPETILRLGSGFQEVKSGAGPMMAVSRKAYMEVGGFPPDTIGVETNRQAGTFRRLYIGPGDYGLCQKVRDIGYKVYYSPKSSCYHFIPTIRFTVSFWRSRMIGEGHHVAVTNREFNKLSKWALFKKRRDAKASFVSWKNRLIRRLKVNEIHLARTGFKGMLHEELWLHYHKSYLEMDTLLTKYSYLSKFLWKMGLNGVPDNNFDQVIDQLPAQFLELVESEKMYIDRPITSVDEMKLFGF